MKRTGCIIFVSLILILVCLFAGASAPAKNNAWILLPETKIMSEPSYSSTELYSCKQNDEVVIFDEQVKDDSGVVWQKVGFNGVIIGYLPEKLLYYTSQSITEKIRIVKISPQKMGETVPLYKTLNDNDPVLELTDGAKVVLLGTTADYGDYSYVEYEGNNYFVLTKYITDTLTYNQKIAIIIAVAIVGIVICSAVILLLYRKKNITK